MDSQKNIISSVPAKGMFLDLPPSLQPEGTYREAWGVVNSTDRETGFGISNEASNAIHTLIPDGYEIRGMAYAEERDWFVLFLYSEKDVKSEIGIVDEKTKTYRTVVNDDKLPDGKMCFGDEFINIELKVEQPCNELYAYWSNDYTYRYINLENDCCDHSLANMRLFRCLCGPVIEPYIQDGGGTLANGAYQFVAQLEDGDGNKTNWFKVSQPVYVAQKDFKAGEPTRRSIRLDLTDLDPEYEQVNIAVIKTIDGTTEDPEIIFRSNYGTNKLSLVYSGQKGSSIPLTEVLTKSPGYIRGRNLAQKDGRLILYNLLGETNLDYQKLANEIKVDYSVALVPASDSHLIKTVRRDENYLLGIRWNYCDGTSSADFIIPGREPDSFEKQKVSAGDDENCFLCDKPRWAVFNTADYDNLKYKNPLFYNEFEASLYSSSLFKPADKRPKYTPPSYSEETEETIIPDALKEILDQKPKEQLSSDICECISKLINVELVGTANEDPLILKGFLGMSKECCEKLAEKLNKNGGGFVEGFNEIFGSLDDLLATDPFEGGVNTSGLDPGLNCADYKCIDGSCPPGCQCGPDFVCSGSGGGTGGGGGGTPEFSDVVFPPDLGPLPPGYVPPSKTVEQITKYFHDITLTDIDGNMHTIKDYLDDGKVVYLEAFTTWCGGCYDLHVSKDVDFFYEKYGPGGLDIAQVIAVEMDPSTTIDDIQGTGTKTQGEYSNAPYPIVAADSDMAELLITTYGINFFPQIIVIYPNGQVRYTSAKELEKALDSYSTLTEPIVPLPMLANPLCPSGNCGGTGPCSGGNCGGCFGNNCSGSCGGTGSCSDQLDFNTCYSCREDGYCRYTCFKKPETTLQAIQNLLFHVVEKRKRRKFYRYSGVYQNNDRRTEDIGFESVNGGSAGGASGGPEQPPTPSTSSLLKYQTVSILSDDGCEVIRKEYPIVSGGRLGTWLSSEIYPLTTDCNGDYLFGELAGRRVRLHRIPNADQEPHFISYHDGVVHAGDTSAYELQETYVRPIWLNFKNIQSPENLPKPLCPNNPFTITYVKRDPTNKRVIASGIFTHTFIGNVFDKDYVFPKHAVNSLEYIDRNVYNDQDGSECDPTLPCYYTTDCGPGCDCVGATVISQTKYCQAPGPIECDAIQCDPNVGCKAGCDCLPINDAETCADGICNVGKGCFPDCTCQDVPQSAGLPCVPVYQCYPKPECELIPCTSNADCEDYDNCSVCRELLGTAGTCVPITQEKKGKVNDFPIYNFHSPDTSFDRPFIGGVNRAKFDLTLFGWGFRHGLYAEAEEPDTIWQTKIDQRGTRQSVNLNHYTKVLGQKYKCISATTYADADTIVDAPEGFFYEVNEPNGTKIIPAPLMNLNRESSVFIQFRGNYVNPLPKQIRADLNDIDSEYIADDASFLGDGHCHECIVPRAGAWYGSIIHERQDQYGSVEGLRMIPFGVEGSNEDLLRGKISSTTGDAYIGPWTLVRKSYVSNKVGTAAQLGINNIGFFDEPISSWLKRFLCWGDCSKLPISCNGRDPKNRSNLRPWIRQCPDIDGVFLRDNIRDYYYPRTLKTLIVSWVESDTNTWFRELGEQDDFELAYPYLKEKPLDSSLTQQHYDQCFLNQFAVRHERIPQWKIYAKAIARIIAIMLPLLWFVNGGFAINEPYFDIFLIVLRFIIVVALWILLVFVIATCTNLNRLFSIVQCKTDDQGAPEDENVYGFRDNYTRYNYDFSLVNDLDFGLSVTSTYDVRPCLAEETNKIVYSDPQVVGSPRNAWRNFKINNYLELPLDAGYIQEVFVLGDRIFIQTTDNMWTVYANQAQLQSQNTSEIIYLGRGDFMSRADAIYGGVTEGTLGTLDPNASVITRYGHISVDREAHKLNIFAGQNLQSLSDSGLRHFMKEHLRLFLVEQFPDFKLVDKKHKYGVGFSIGIDNELDRILVTKIDYEAYDPSQLTLTEDGRAFLNKEGEHVLAGDPRYFCNKSFTASYSFLSGSWISFHYYTPTWYAWNRFTMYSFNNRALWEHNILGSWQEFYGEHKEMVVEIVASSSQPFRYESTTLDTEAYTWLGKDYATGTKVTFNKLVAYNRHQSTGELNLTPQEDRSILENSMEDTNAIALEYNLPRWSFADLRDKLINANDLHFEYDCQIGPKKVNNKNISLDITNNTLVDNYLVYSLTFSTFDDIKLLVRAVHTAVDIEER